MWEAMMMYLRVFFVGGLICLIAQILIIRTKLTSARILVLFLMIGAVLGGAGVYKEPACQCRRYKRHGFSP